MNKYRVKPLNGGIVLCDEHGEPIPRQTYCCIESKVDEPMSVSIRCIVEPNEVHPDILGERRFSIVEDVTDWNEE